MVGQAEHTAVSQVVRTRGCEKEKSMSVLMGIDWHTEIFIAYKETRLHIQRLWLVGGGLNQHSILNSQFAIVESKYHLSDPPLPTTTPILSTWQGTHAL